jgi:ubiquinone/menaquinone biosynthesis C-methylase UbiE
MSHKLSSAALIEQKYADDGPDVVRAYQSLNFGKHLRLLQTHMGLRPGARVLDIGCGTGALLIELAVAGARVVGVDTFEEADGIDLEIARARLREQSVDASLLQASAADLPFASNSFDLAVNIGMLEHIPPDVRPGVLREMFRVIRPDGHLFLIAGPTAVTPFDQHIPGHAFSNWLPRERKVAISQKVARRQFLAIPWGISRRELRMALPNAEFASRYADFFGLDGGQPLGRFRASPIWALQWAKRRLGLNRVFAGMAHVLYTLHQEHCHILAVRKRGQHALSGSESARAHANAL